MSTYTQKKRSTNFDFVSNVITTTTIPAQPNVGWVTLAKKKYQDHARLTFHSTFPVIPSQADTIPLLSVKASMAKKTATHVLHKTLIKIHTLDWRNDLMRMIRGKKEVGKREKRRIYQAPKSRGGIL